MDTKFKERLMTMENELGENVRNEVLDNLKKRDKFIKKESKKLINDDMILERYYKEIEKVNNQDYLPLIYYILYDTKIDQSIHCKEYTFQSVKNMEEQLFDRLMRIVKFINSLVLLNKSKEEIYSMAISNGLKF